MTGAFCNAHQARLRRIFGRDIVARITGLQFATSPEYKAVEHRELRLQPKPIRAPELQEIILEAEAEAQYQEAGARFLEEQRANQSRQLAQGVEDYWMARKLQDEESHVIETPDIQLRGDSCKDVSNSCNHGKVGGFGDHTVSEM